MPKRDKQHEEEAPKESTTKYEGGQGSKTREQQAKNNATKLHDFDEPPADEHSDSRGKGPGSSGRGSTGKPNGG